MTRRVAWALSIAAILLGLAHVSIGVMSFERLNFQALWFTGAGLAIVLGGMINLLGLTAADEGNGRVLLIIANLVMAGFFALALIILPAPQVIVGLLLFAALAALPLLRSRAAA